MGTQELIVKYHNGTIEFQYHNASAAQVRQVLEQIQPELKAKCGNYTWQMVGDTFDGYKIIAYHSYGHGLTGKFTESIGKSPSIVLKNFYAARQILADKYNIH